MFRLFAYLAFAAALATTSTAHAADAEAGWGATVATKHVTSRLVADAPAAAPGKTVRVALDQTIIPKWHTYWKNPGDTGLPTRINWTLPAGWQAGAIQWPTPAVYKIGALVNYGYEDEVRLLTDITVPKDAPVGETVTLTAQAQWLVCSDICIPERATLTLALKIDPAGGPPSARTTALFRQARAALPGGTLQKAAFVTSAGGNRLDVALTPAQAANAKSAYFFAENPKVLAAAAPQKLTLDEAGLHLALPAAGEMPAGPVRGILVLASTDATSASASRRAFLIEAAAGATGLSAQPAAAVETDAAANATTVLPEPDESALATTAAAPVAVQSVAAEAAGAAPTTAPVATDAAAMGLLQAALFALLGGVILNLMPCVFPVLSMKALALAKHGRTHARAHGLAYAAGVMACFLAVALTLIGLRIGGAQIGWGFQLQSPVVVAVLAYVMFVLGLSMSGVFNINGGFVNLGSGLAGREGLVGSFFTGVLATLVATPCTAPFMGAAIGYALVQPWPFAMTVFLALGFGMALPFLLLTFCEPLLKRIPRPGPWMDRLKHILAFPLYASTVWLVWVLAIQSGPDAVAAVLGGMVLLAFAAWMYGQPIEGNWRFAARGATLVAVVCAVALLGGPVSAGRPPEGGSNAMVAEGEIAFTQAKLDSLRSAGQPVLVNMTAAWCITCLANERTSLSRDSVKSAMAKKQVAYVKGDWTSEDPAITQVLRQFGRDGVPLYLLYRPGEASPVVLPQLLTEKIVLDALAPLPDKA